MNNYFIHIPKTGGTSFKEYVGTSNVSFSATSREFIFWQGYVTSKYHLTVVQNLDLFGQDFYHKFDKTACFVRDPYTRFLSSVGEHRVKFPDLSTAKMSLDELLMFLDDTRNLAFAVFTPQWRFVFHPEVWFNGRFHSFRKGGCRVADKIFSFETYEDSVNSMQKFFGLQPKKEKLGKHRSTKISDKEKELFSNILSSKPGSSLWKSKQSFYQLYAKDFYCFNYDLNSSVDCVFEGKSSTEISILLNDPFWNAVGKESKKWSEPLKESHPKEMEYKFKDTLTFPKSLKE